MPVPYKLYQNTRDGSTTRGMWYARATHYGVLTTDKLADQIAAATTLTKTDIVACIQAFLEYIRQGLQNGQRVTLDKFGSFKVGFRTAPAESPKKWMPSTHLKALTVIFQPAVQTSADHKRSKSLLSGVTVEEMQAYNVDKGDGTTNP